MDFTGKKVIITGGASGIGRSAALNFAKRGADVAVIDLNIEEAEKTCEQINEMGSKSLALKVDITNLEEVVSMAKKVNEFFGRIDILVNNAAWDEIEFFMETTPPLWEKLIQINLMGHINCTKAVLEYMIKQEKGVIVYVASDAARVGSFGESVYSAAKGGVLSFSKTMAREMARYNIRVNCICPGPTLTPLFEEVREKAPNVVKAIIKSIPMKRLAQPEEIANGIVFLASDLASFINGQALSINGGLNML